MKNKRHIKNIGKKRLHMMSKTMNNNFELSQWLCHDDDDDDRLTAFDPGQPG